MLTTKGGKRLPLIESADEASRAESVGGPRVGTFCRRAESDEGESARVGRAGGERLREKATGKDGAAPYQ